MRLKSVVFPAPFGPMRARRSPARTSSPTPFTARRPPKSLVTPSSLSASSATARSSAPPAPQGTHQAAGREEDDADVDGTQDEEPSLRVHADEVLEEHDDPGAESRSDQGARAAQRRHEERLDRSDVLDVNGTDEAVVVGPEHAGQTGEG